MLDAFWSRLEFLDDLRKHPIARWVFLAWAIVSIYDTFGSQFLPEDWAQKRPTVYQLVVMTTGWFPWEAWLLIGAAILVIFALEYPARQKRQLALANGASRSKQRQKMSVPIIGMIVCLVGFVGFLIAWIGTGTGRTSSPSTHFPSSDATIPFSLSWDDHLGHSYSSEGTNIITEAIQIGARNGPNREMRLEDAYIISGQGAGEVPMKIDSDRGWIAPGEASAIPPNHPILLRAEFTPMPARDFFEKWKTFRITVKHDGGAMLTKDVDENTVAAIYSSFRPNPIAPRVTAKPAAADELLARARFLYDQNTDTMRVISKQDLEIATVDKNANWLFSSNAIATFNFGHFTARFAFSGENGPFDVRISGEPIGPLAMMSGSVLENEKSYVRVEFFPTFNTKATPSVIMGAGAPTSAEITVSFYKRQSP